MSYEDTKSSAALEVQKDIRPELLNQTEKVEIEKKKVETRTKYRKELEESRNAVSNAAIEPANKGVALMQKTGMELGPEKSNRRLAGLIIPIKLEVRVGLGKEDEIRRRIKRREERKQRMKVYLEQGTLAMTEEFRDRRLSKNDYKRLVADLRKCQKICEKLDVENRVRRPIRPWFWHQLSVENEDPVEEKVEDFSPEEKIHFIIEYMRPKYLCCPWCCIRFNDEEDMFFECPGTEKICHREWAGSGGNIEDIEIIMPMND